MNNKNGSSLLITMVFIVLGAALAASALKIAINQIHITGREIRMERAFYIAESGLEVAAQVIADADGYLAEITTGSENFGKESYTYTITKTGWRTYRIESEGLCMGVKDTGDIKRVVSVDRIYQPTYGKFSMWMRVNGNIWFAPWDEISGLVHSDLPIKFLSDETYGGTLFHDKVTSLASTYLGSTNYVEFKDGFQMNTTNGSMARVDFDKLHTLANNPILNGLVLEGYTAIVIDNHNMKITNERMGWTSHIVPIENDQLVYIKNSSSGDMGTRPGKLYFYGGTLDGRLSLVTENDIRIHDHVRYANNPADDHLDPAYRDYPNPSDDALGLISKDDVWIIGSSPDNLDLYASIMATGQYEGNSGSFGVLGHDELPVKGSLNVYGGIVQDTRGPVGTFNSTGQASGYHKNYCFDNRFGTYAPPYFPAIDEDWALEGWSDGPA